MASAAMMAGAVQTYATIAVAIAAIGLPLYQLRRDGFLPRLRRRD
ncbi:hypothetical protein [Capillimicrobium parvum]|uniref:Uncharacterized protein n=1 Tax=Capillimicrobium parvum TaxID=2884022 RepID=A0A9E6XW46_9ACTN|nr:hypothetical protein [Capillimicrobium parvum]UGS35198.1 hypothetical protein DSM104329_01583 [Capillimicrobium parvum]